MVQIQEPSLTPVRKSIPSNSEMTIRKKLDYCLNKAVEHCIDTQTPSGAWEVTPDPRIFETALVAYALSRTPGNECAKEVERVREDRVYE